MAVRRRREIKVPLEDYLKYGGLMAGGYIAIVVSLILLGIYVIGPAASRVLEMIFK